ncbi:MAG: di-trans,poly-cis-decaprenylcistransferase [Spirochaetes bacterium]|nr:di-trans,poly-cis-decaprenylcistransferase [Spirochaetota bacterium]MBU0956138.1 di-trans,poly-cis-decaprenylcistransferase [Spirochaetota bacterium]
MSSSERGGVPQHIGIIMDGNGRWAKLRGMARTEGHRQGLETAKNIVRAARQAQVPFLSLYTFSTENWKRTADEVGFLMNLIPGCLRAEMAFYHEHGVRVVHSGNLAQLPKAVQLAIEETRLETAGNKGITVNLAINYGGRDELVRALRKLAADSSTPADSITEATISAALDQPELPDPDFIIRTGGDVRMSNFLLWQAAYAELYFTDILWPDWNELEFSKALDDFRLRKRRFGGTD